MGSPKQLARLGSETLLERAARIAVEAGLDPVIGVLPANLSIEPLPKGMISVVNHDAAEGMASSIRAGLHALMVSSASIPGAIILVCDQPAVTAEHLRKVAEGGREIVASAYAGRKGVPAYFPVTAFDALLTLHGDAGARDLLQGARAIELRNGDLDIDTFPDLDRARKLFPN